MAAQNFQDKIGALVKGARKMGIHVMPPDVNRSSYRFSLGDDNNIVYGLGAVKNVGEGATEDIIDARKDKPFTSLRNFLMRVSSKRLNKKAAESLIKAGAFDSVDANRTKLLAELQNLSSRHSIDRAAQSTLFGTGAVMESESSEFVWDLDTRLAYEKDALGFFLSGHPLTKSSELLKSMKYLSSSALEERRDNSSVDLVGTLVKLERKRNRRGQLYAQLVFEDFDGEFQGLVFPNKFEEIVQILRKDESYFLKGKLALQERGHKILLDRVIPLEQAPSLLGRWLVLRLGPGGVDDQAMDAIHALLSRNEGQVPVYLKIGKKLYRSRSIRVSLNKELLGELSSLLGEGNAVIVT
jgi:DNA polymerase-3 subunit alpha